MKYLFFLPFGSINYRFIGKVIDEQADVLNLMSITSGTFITATKDAEDSEAEDPDTCFYTSSHETIVVCKFPEYQIIK